MKANVIVSAVTGFFFGFLGYFALVLLKIDRPFQLSIAFGLLFALFLFPFLVAYEKIMEKRYTKFEKEITSPVFYKANGNFNLGNGKIKNGNIYFCEDGIVCVCLDEKPYTLDEIRLQDIDYYEFDQIHLNIHAKDGRVFVMTLLDAPKIIEALRAKGRV